ncbi:shTK domain protein [Dictyocaulus viviparus]|uniref:ShTK domain protein n=1 Tax=Dictyocaulus viviparus TaxID=29172 RepID=A0A0D8YAS0_DICVI|nr:shTK domain protein [Dictyocaulus viviparus]
MNVVYDVVVVVAIVIAGVAVNVIIADDRHVDDVRVRHDHVNDHLTLPTATDQSIRMDIVSVYRLLPKNRTQFNIIRSLYENSTNLQLNFWKTAKNLNGFWDVMVDKKNSFELLDKLSKNEIDYLKTIDDVQKLIMIKERQQKPRRLHDESSAPYYDFNQYGSYDQMVSWMKALAKNDPQHVLFISVGKTHEGRSIDGVEIGQRDRSKRIFWIDGGIHAREWAAPHTALYFIHQLTSRHKSDPTLVKLLEEITFVIVPCINPDGYEFSRSSTNPHIRLWRKNRSAKQCREDSWGRKRCCRGVDLNRNFDFHFKESGSSDDPCSEIYQGIEAFSEPEARAIRDAILSRRYRNRVDAYITLHTYSQIWIHPYGHRKDSYPGDIRELYDVGKKAAKALQNVYGTKYLVGSGADTLYWDGFILGESELIPTARETWEGVKVVAGAVLERAQRKLETIEAPTAKRFRFGDGTEGSCYDLRHACKRWIAERPELCRTVPIFMRENCAYSCGKC